MFYTKEKKRHVRPSISIAMMVIISVSAYVSIGTENVFLCGISALVFIASLILANKLGV